MWDIKKHPKKASKAKINEIEDFSYLTVTWGDWSGT